MPVDIPNQQANGRSQIKPAVEELKKAAQEEQKKQQQHEEENGKEEVEENGGQEEEKKEEEKKEEEEEEDEEDEEDEVTAQLKNLEEGMDESYVCEREKIKCDGKVIGEVTVFVIKDQALKTFVRQFVDSDKLWGKEAKLESTELLMSLPSMQTALKALEKAGKKVLEAGKALAKNHAKMQKNGKGKGKGSPKNLALDEDGDLVDVVSRPIKVRSLVSRLEAENEELMEMIEHMKQEGIVSYNCLWSVFQPGMKVSSHDGEDFVVGGEVDKTRYQRSCWSNDFCIDTWMIKINNMGKFQTVKQSLRIPAFKGTRKIDELHVKPMDEDTLRVLTERGRKFVQVARGSHYMGYSGPILKRSWWSTQMFRADGRVMCDSMTHKRMNPNYSYTCSNDTSKTIASVPEEKLFSAWPTVLGFSFTSKKWGELAVDKLEPVRFDDDAYERLVLDAEKKTLIQALVENQGAAVTDLISGKGGGCIFLLHGPPGTGKTLTAEAIAELLHRPLYSVSVGELGTSTTELEKALRDILEVATTWNAVILIDEADIFLEKRTENDIVRNAMVGIFLRLLEYHQGVLFLTTNRVRCFDEAFHSRISVALHYEALTAKARASVWRNFLEMAGIPDALDADELGKFELNGRQIKNTIRLAQALAKSEGVSLQNRHVQRTINVAREFQADMLEQEQKQQK